MSSSRTLDITDDLTEQQLAESAFGDDIIVYWYVNGVRTYGLITGYEDPGAAVGVFVINEVELVNNSWRELDSTLRLSRVSFTVFGPMEPHTGIKSPEISKYLSALYLLLGMKDTTTGIPALRVRLDADLADKTVGKGEVPRKYRLLVRSAFPEGLMHDDIARVLQIAERHELQVSHENVGLVLGAQGS